MIKLLFVVFIGFLGGMFYSVSNPEIAKDITSSISTMSTDVVQSIQNTSSDVNITKE